MAGARFDRVVLNRADLRQPFPAGFARRLRRQRVQALTRRGKYLLAVLSSGDTLVMHLGMSGWLRAEPTAREATPARSRRGPREPPRPRRLPDVVRHDGDLQRSPSFRRHGSRAGRRARPARVPWPDGPGAAIPRLRCNRPGQALRQSTHQPQGRAPRPADCGRHRQHLRERGAPSGEIVAVPRGRDHCDGNRRTAPGRGTPRRRHQDSPPAGNQAGRFGPVSRLAVPRVRPGRRSVPDARLPWRHRADLARGTIHVLLSGLPALTCNFLCRGYVQYRKWWTWTSTSPRSASSIWPSV